MRKITILVLCTLMLGACTKIKVDVPDFDVSVDKLTYKANDTVTFNFKGYAHNIVFYSGELGHNYDYKDRTQADGIPQLQFSTYLQNKGEVNTLLLMASTDFSGVMDSTNIASAHWTDITSRAILSTGTDNTKSGIVALSDFINSGAKPLYLAFKFVGYNSTTLKQPTWTIRTFNVNNVLPDGRSYPLTTVDQTGWAAVDIKNPTIKWAVPSTGIASINGTIAGSTLDDNEDWLIARPLDLKFVGRDLGISIQDLGSSTLENYQYTFTTPGTYTVNFVAFNNSIASQEAVIKPITLTITP